MLTKTNISQCKIILEGTLILSNLKMINKMPTLSPPWKNFCERPWMVLLSRFRFFVLSSIRNCFFPFS